MLLYPMVVWERLSPLNWKTSIVLDAPCGGMVPFVVVAREAEANWDDTTALQSQGSIRFSRPFKASTVDVIRRRMYTFTSFDSREQQHNDAHSCSDPLDASFIDAMLFSAA